MSSQQQNQMAFISNRGGNGTPIISKDNIMFNNNATNKINQASNGSVINSPQNNQSQIHQVYASKDIQGPQIKKNQSKHL